jgi:hypothetical protein
MNKRQNFFYKSQDYPDYNEFQPAPLTYTEGQVGFNKTNEMFVKNMQLNTQTADKKSPTYANQQMQKNNVSFDKISS